jgi:hypothetical protein
MASVVFRPFALRLMIVGLLGVTTTSYAAEKKAEKKFVEADACSLATSEVLSRQGGDKKVELKVSACRDFSKFEQGFANIYVAYDTSYFNDYMKARYETKNLVDVCNFIKTADGWKIQRCKLTGKS